MGGKRGVGRLNNASDIECGFSVPCDQERHGAALTGR
jgi:hypothetical protein